MFQINGVMAQADAATMPFPDKFFHCIVTSPPYWGLRKYSGEQGRGMFPNLGLESTPQEYAQNIVEIFREIKRILRDDGVAWLVIADSYASAWSSGRRNLIGNLSRTNRVDRTGGGLQEGDLCFVPSRVAIALQEDGWRVRRDLIWWKRNPMPESPTGYRWERHKIKIASADVDWRQEARDREGVLNGPAHVSGGNVGLKGHRPKLVNCPGCEKCDSHGGYVLRRGSWRHTTAHEYIFMLTKQMKYWCNQEAVREIYTEPLDRWAGPQKSVDEAFKGDEENVMRGLHRDRDMRPHAGRNPRSVLDVPHEAIEPFSYWLGERTGIDLYEAMELFFQESTNPNGVLDIPTSSYKGAHYATFPPKLITPLIMASCPRRTCPECRQGWAPVVEKGDPAFGKTSWGMKGMRHFDLEKGEMSETSLEEGSTLKHDIPRRIIGYRPTCECGHDDYVPGWVLDPFFGSGTVGEVARGLGVNFAGVDISMPYLSEQARVRAFGGTPPHALDNLPLFQTCPDESDD